MAFYRKKPVIPLEEREHTEEEESRAKKRAMYLLGDRDYSEKELYDKLLSNYSVETCDAVTALMVEYGYLDDERYARKLAAYLITNKKFGKSRVRFEMKRRGLSEELVELTLEEYGGEDYGEEIRAIIRKRYMDDLDDRQGLQRVIAALARRGYGYSEVKAAIEQVKSDVELNYDDYENND